MFGPFFDALDHLEVAAGELERIRNNPAGVSEPEARALIARTNRACDHVERLYEEIQSPAFLQRVRDRFEPIEVEESPADLYRPPDTSFADDLWGRPARGGLFR
jgi:hypothetical protein